MKGPAWKKKLVRSEMGATSIYIIALFALTAPFWAGAVLEWLGI